jgi:hypothetical protein
MSTSTSKKAKSNGSTPHALGGRRLSGKFPSPYISPDIKPDETIFNSSGFSQKKSSMLKQRIPDDVRTPGTPWKKLKTSSISRISSETLTQMLYTPYAHFLSPTEEHDHAGSLARTTGSNAIIMSNATERELLYDNGCGERSTSWTPQPMRKSSRSETSEDYLTKTFEMIQKIGSGSFADVFKVRERTTGRLFAVKKTRQPFMGFKDRLMKLAEVQKLSMLGDHSHCVRLFDAWEQNGYVYMQTELCNQGR